jgi:sterol desaturase/sphingolipid hydroxylase (fatty acid hydroxylase superfamily)
LTAEHTIIPSPGGIEGLTGPLMLFLQRCYERALELPGWLVDGGNRFFWVYLLTFVALGVVAREVYYRNTNERRENWFRFIFPRDMYTHPSAILDYKLLLFNRILGPATFVSGIVFQGLSISFIALLVQGGLHNLAGSSYSAYQPGVFLSVAVIVCLTLARDFSTYVTHALHHRWPLLWAFHKVHHSAEVLTPATVYRKHPVYNLFSSLTDFAIVGPAQGLVLFAFGAQPDPITLFGVNFIFSIFHLAGSNLRHSHIWLSFGPRLEHIFISPAQHQIHHSKAPHHWDRNFGEVFAIWDWLFGTLYVPGKEREIIEFGAAGDDTQAHPTVFAAYVQPFRDCARLLGDYRRRFLTRGAARVSALAGDE